MEEGLDVVVVGSIFMDLISYSDRLPKPGETIEGNDFKSGFGGKGANQCVAAARLGSRTAFVGKVGDDSNGVEYLNHLKAEGVDTSKIKTEHNVPTGVASIMVSNENGENIIVIVPGASALVSPSYVEESKDVIAQAKVLLVQLEIPMESTEMALKVAKEFNVKTILNTAPVCSNIEKRIIQLCDIICLNEVETEMITGLEVSSLSEAEAAFEKISEKFGYGNSIIITFGHKGVAVKDTEKNEIYTFLPPKVEAIDTTGAGDCFLGTLASRLAANDSLKMSTEKAVLSATDSVTRKGTQSSFPTSIPLQTKQT